MSCMFVFMSAVVTVQGSVGMFVVYRGLLKVVGFISRCEVLCVMYLTTYPYLVGDQLSLRMPRFDMPGIVSTWTRKKHQKCQQFCLPFCPTMSLKFHDCLLVIMYAEGNLPVYQSF